MKKVLAVIVVFVLFLPIYACNSSTIASCNHDINFVKYTDEYDFTQIMKGKVPLISLEKSLSNNIPYTRETILSSDSLIEIKLTKEPKAVDIREYWLDRNGVFIDGTVGPFSTTGSCAIDDKTVLLPMVRRFDYIIQANKIASDGIIYKGFEMTITFKNDVVEKFAFITQSK